MHCTACDSPVALDSAFCAVCGASVGPQCPRCARQCRTGERFCGLCGADLGVNADAEHGQERRRAERKLVSIVFIDMVGFTSLGHQFDPETVREAMTSFFRALASTVRAHGGYVEKFIGDAMMSVFGAPLSREDDAVMALNAAIEMHRVLVDVNAIWSQRLGRSIQIRIGVNSGIAVAGPIGEGRATDYGVCGDVVNVASRLQSAADPGQTIVGEMTRELGGRGFLYQSIPPLVLKGKPDPVPALRLIGRSEATTEFFDTIPLFGRDNDVARVKTVLANARSNGERMLIHLRGDTGTGKSRLLRALADDPVLATYRRVSPSASGSSPLTHLREIARAIAPIPVDYVTIARRILSADDTLAVGLVSWLLEDDGPPDSVVAMLDGGRRTELLSALLGGLLETSDEPVALLLDDVSRLDAASLALLSACLNRQKLTRSLVIATGDSQWTPPWPTYEDVEIGILQRDDLRSMLLHAVGDEEIPADIAEALISAANGNPRALSELTWAYRQTGQVPTVPADGMTGTLLALIQSRIDAVDANARRVLQVGATIGPHFAETIVRAVVSDVADIDGALARLRRRNLIVGSGDDCRFPQTAIRTVAYEGLLRSERSQLHTAVARALVAGASANALLIAHHFELGDDDAEAISWMTRAVAVHQAAGDAQSALELARRSFVRIGARDELGGVTRAHTQALIADLLMANSEVEAAIASYDAAIEICTDPIARSDMHRRLALCHVQRGDEDQALDTLQMARDDITLAEMDGVGEVDDIFTSLASLGAAGARVHFEGGRFEESSWEAQTAIEMLSHISREKASEAQAERAQGEAHLVMAEAFFELGDVDRSVESADIARQSFDHLHDLSRGLRADLIIARTRATLGFAPEAHARAESVLRLAERMGDDASQAAARALLASLDTIDTRIASASAHQEERH